MSTEQDSIRQLAFQLWQQRGRPDGSAEQDWLAAEKQLGKDTSAADQKALITGLFEPIQHFQRVRRYVRARYRMLRSGNDYGREWRRR